LPQDFIQDGIITAPEKPLRVHIKQQQKNKKQKPTEEIHLSDDEPELVNFCITSSFILPAFFVILVYIFFF